MLIVLGLIVLLAAVIVAVAGVIGNTGTEHALNSEFSVLDYHVTGSTGTLFLYGIAVGAVAMFGLSMLLAGARRNARHARLARHELRRRDEATTYAREDVAPVAATGTAPRTWRHPFGGSGTGASPTAAH